MKNEPLITITYVQYEDMLRSIEAAHKFMQNEETVLRTYYSGTHTGFCVLKKDEAAAELVREIERLKQILHSQNKNKSWFNF